jgi:hypothetical protein
MPNAIAKLIDRPEQLVENIVSKLEDLNGQPSEDVRLLAENLQKTRIKISQLGLDPDDTTGQELYHCLRAKFVKDSDQLDRALGIKEGDEVGLRADKATQMVASLAGLPEMWLLKHNAAKDLLRRSPPKKLMKKFNYHSVQSLLKRENLDNIFLAATLLESEAWQAGLAKKVAKLGYANFEIRRLHVVSLPSSYYKNSVESKLRVVTSPHLGSVAIWRAGLPDNASTLAIANLLANGLEKLSGTSLGAEFFALNPALRWWSDNSNLVSAHDSGPVSLSLKDIAHNTLYDHTYQDRTNKHGAKALFDTLLSRYQNQSDRLSDSMRAMGYNLSNNASTGVEATFGSRLAVEYAMAE